MIPVMDNDTSAFFGQHATTDVPRDQWKRYVLPDPRTGEKVDGWTRATTFAATIAEQYALRVWKERQVVWGLARRPDLITMASTISGPEDKQALGEIVTEAHIAAGTDGRANRGKAVHRACQASEAGRHHEVPDELRPHVAGFFQAVGAAGLELMSEYVERVVIVDRYHVAGQFDNLVRCPDGKIRVLDKKTGRMDFSDTEFAVQQALYAHADAVFNYETGRYEALPEIATDYAILAHIDPDTGHCELLRINIEWGWLWARTCAEVMDIRKTKSVITPYVPETVRTTDPFASRADFTAVRPPVRAAALEQGVTFDEAGNSYWVGGQPPTPQDMGPAPVPCGPSYTDFRATETNEQYNARVAAPVESTGYGSIPGGHYNDALGVPTEFQVFWSDSELDEDDGSEVTAMINGVPLMQYGQSSQWPCARNEPCEFTGADGLHSDGTVCLFGNQRPAPVPVLPGEEIRWNEYGTMMVQRDGQWVPGAEQTLEQAAHTAQSPVEITQQTGVVVEDLGGITGEPTDAELTRQSMSLAERAEEDAPDGPDDDMVAKVMKAHKDKAAMQKLATQLMQSVGVKEGDPEGIRLAQYKADLANAIVTLAYRRGVAVPDLGVPSGPGHPKTKVKMTAAEKKAVAKSAEDTAVQVAGDRAEVIATAVRSIQQQGTINGLAERHNYYAITSIGWTEEMQVAARTRALEIDAAAGVEPLTPDQMIDGATSLETLGKAYQKATNNGQNMAGWTTELNAKAQVKHTELQQLATSVNQ